MILVVKIIVRMRRRARVKPIMALHETHTLSIQISRAGAILGQSHHIKDEQQDYSALK